MPDIFELKSRLDGLKSIHNITYAMQIVTISRLKRIVQWLTCTTEASQEVSQTMATLLAEYPRFYNRLVPKQTSSIPMVMAVFSNRGFCGSYNQDVLSYLMPVLTQYPTAQVVAFGKKAKDVLKRIPDTHQITYFQPERDVFSEAEAMNAYQSVREVLEAGVPIHAVYYGFKSIVTQKMVSESYFPPTTDELPTVETLPLSVPPFCEPNPSVLINRLIDQYRFLRFLTILRNGASSEFSQRFLLMKGAVDNVKGLQEELSIELNKQRQAGITQEVSEIISTFKALSEK